MIDQIITPLPEVVDRYTICQLKLERLDHTQIDVDSMKDQLEYYKKGIDFTNTQLLKLSKDLYNINGRIWDTEGSIRAGLDDELGYDEIGKRAVQVRDLNRVRMSIKNHITELTGEGFKDCKMNYAGEGWLKV